MVVGIADQLGQATSRGDARKYVVLLIGQRSLETLVHLFV